MTTFAAQVDRLEAWEEVPENLRVVKRAVLELDDGVAAAPLSSCWSF